MHKLMTVGLFLALSAGALVACGGGASGAKSPEPAKAATPEAPGMPGNGGGPKAIPHPTAGKEDCVSCHKAGGDHHAMPANHAGRESATCTTCHQPAGK